MITQNQEAMAAVILAQIRIIDVGDRACSVGRDLGSLARIIREKRKLRSKGSGIPEDAIDAGMAKTLRRLAKDLRAAAGLLEDAQAALRQTHAVLNPKQEA